jgi:hypothetical protein
MLTISGLVSANPLSNQSSGPAEAGWRNKFMKVFLRSTKTGKYYQGPSQWTPEQEAALNLQQIAQAVELIFATHLENVEILLSYDDPRYDLVLPVPPSPSRAGRRASDREGLAGEAARPDIHHKKDLR